MTKFGKCEKCLTIFVFCLQKRQERRRNELLPFVEEIVSKTAQEAQFRNNNDGIFVKTLHAIFEELKWSSTCLLYTSPSPRDLSTSRMPSSA